MGSNTALLIIDVQKGQLSIQAPIYEGDKLISRIRELIEKARASNVPVIYVQHCGEKGSNLEPGTSGWEIHPDIAPSKNDVIVQKRYPDSFQETNLQSELESKGIKELVVVGLLTHYCIDTTCRRAFSLGYKVTLVRDGHSTFGSDLLSAPQIIAHHNSVLGSVFCELKSAKDVEF
jgi:nicotinamidase-related amidase